MYLENKVILIISQQAWGGMYVSKHHYAIELAKAGNSVFFLNPPKYDKIYWFKKVEVSESGLHANLFIVQGFFSFPYALKFHFRALFDIFIRSHISKMLKTIARPVDIVWSFDIAHVYPFRFFPKMALKIYHPVDMPHSVSGLEAATGSNIIFSTAPEILEKYNDYKVPKFFINHGLAENFLKPFRVSKPGRATNVGFSGNLLRGDIDRPILLQILSENVDCHFSFWGNYQLPATLKNESDKASYEFIADLQSRKNVTLYGSVSTEELSNMLFDMDAFLICYDLNVKNQPGPNYHKLIEYMSTGKIIISSYISVYKDLPELVQMVRGHDNQDLPLLFRKVISELRLHNSEDAMGVRMQFAHSNTYKLQVARIANILSQR